MAQGGEIQPGSGIVIDPFVPALTGDITVWLNQGAGPGTPTLNFIVEAPNEVSIVTTLNGSEPAINGQFTVSLTEVAATDTTVTYTVGGSATPDGDYTALTGTVTIPTGSLSAVIDVAVSDDLEVEALEDVIVTLTGATGDANLVLGTATAATVTITDDDAAPPALTVGLFDATTDTLIATLTDGVAINASAIAGKNLTISATVPTGSPFAGQVGSVNLNLNNGQVNKTESVTPYALFGDSAGNLAGGNLALPTGSNNTIVLNIFSGAGSSGTNLGTVALDFTIVDDSGVNLAAECRE